MIEQSLWRSISTPSLGARDLPNHVDVVVVGAGITGLTAAYLLKQTGKRVAVLERERVGSGDTGNTSAHLTHVTDLRLSDLRKRFGKDVAQLVWHGGEAAIDLIETLVSELQIDCGFHRVPGFLHAAIDGEKDESEQLREEFELAIELGFSAQFHRRGPIRGLPAVSYADQAIFHPLRYTAALAQAVDGDGSIVCEQSEFAEALDDPMAVIVNGRNITCDHLIIATHVPLMGLTGLVSATLFQTKLYPYSSYVLGARMAQSSLAPGLYSDTSDPYYYLRVHDAGDHLYAIFGGADHKTGQSEDTETCYAQVEKTLGKILRSARVERRWSGQVIETSDGLPYIGETADKQFVATGYAGNGLTFGTLAGIMAHDWVLNYGNPWCDVLDPHRKALTAGLTTFISENVDYPVRLILDRLRRDRTSDVDSVGRGDGKVLTVNGKPTAVHRTNTGKLIMLSPVCTHMGCHVRWNNAEQTWDCPCHGSRFTPEGLVLGGPAEDPLQRHSEATTKEAAQSPGD
jgi:glycine/D-amino acid oxidase-like deaminating enzyme/nitrite reductase/ring-hydroxylating ferredoxin subunit